MLPGGDLAKEKVVLFPRAETAPAVTEEDVGQKESDTRRGKQDEGPEGVVTYEDFARVKLRTAKIISAEKVAGTQKLMKLEVLMGEEKRQLVAGIAEHYSPEELVGKTVVVVANLKPARIRGIESRGMLLAASRGERLRLITVDGEIASGAEVK